MEAKDFLFYYLQQHGDSDEIRRFKDFFSPCSYEEFDEQLQKKVFVNTKLKHSLAKNIVDNIVNCGGAYLQMRNNVDVRLQCFVSYYLVKEILNKPIDMETAQHIAHCTIGKCRVDKGSYLPGNTFSSENSNVPVRMSPGADIHLGYRTFIINLLCFDCNKLLMGCRCDSGPVWNMKYHKGCRPVGIRKGANGIDWTVFQVDMALTDDNTAIFSNGLEGDGTVEVCDWINDNEQRVLFRENL